MTDRMQVLAVLIGLCIFMSILDLVRRRKLSEVDSIFWLCASLVILTIPVFVRSLPVLFSVMGVFDPNAGLFFCALVFVLIHILVLAVRVTHVWRGQIALAQHLALLEARIAPGCPDARDSSDASHSPDSADPSSSVR